MILASAQVVGQPMIMLRQTLMATGDVKKPAFFDLAQAIINLVLSIALVRAFGVVGVAWGTWLPLMSIELLVLLPYGMRQLRFRGRELLQIAVVPQLLPLGLLLIYCEAMRSIGFQPGWTNVALVAVGAGAVLAACWGVRRIRPLTAAAN
jgi:Na+-driven multidrug efflux pump